MSEFIEVAWSLRWHLLFIVVVGALVVAATRGEVIHALREEERDA